MFLRDERQPLHRWARSVCMHCTWAHVSSPFTLGLLGQNQHALLHMCVSTAPNILLLSHGQLDSRHEL